MWKFRLTFSLLLGARAGFDEQNTTRCTSYYFGLKKTRTPTTLLVNKRTDKTHQPTETTTLKHSQHGSTSEQTLQMCADASKNI